MAGDLYLRAPSNTSFRLRVAATPELSAAVNAANAAKLAAQTAEATTTSNATATAADVVSTHADVVTTNANADSTAADAVSTHDDAVATAADRVQTGIDATNASNSEVAAAASAAEAAAAADNFDDVYLGSKASDPTLDNDGNALVEGQLYWNSVSNALKIYDGASWNSYSAASGLTAVVDDSAPALGGDLDANGHTIAGRNVATDGTKLDGIEALADVTDAGNVGAAINGASSKSAPADADKFGFLDSAASFVLVYATWANIKATLKTATDALYQALNANLTALSGLSTAADKISYWTGSSAAALADFPSQARTFLAATTAALQRAALGLVIGTDVQAFDAQLSSLMPQHSINSDTTLALTDLGKQIYMSGGSSKTLTIPANSSIAFAIGAVISGVNDSGNSWSLAITTDTLVWSPSKGTGSRTLADGAMFTLEKVTSTKWYLGGVGIT